MSEKQMTALDALTEQALHWEKHARRVYWFNVGLAVFLALLILYRIFFWSGQC